MDAAASLAASSASRVAGRSVDSLRMEGHGREAHGVQWGISDIGIKCVLCFTASHRPAINECQVGDVSM